MRKEPKIYYLTRWSFEEKKGGLEIFETYLKLAFPQMRTITLSQCPPSVLMKRHFGSLETAKAGYLLGRQTLSILKKDPADLLIVTSPFGWYFSLRNPGIPIINIYHGTGVGLFSRPSFRDRGRAIKNLNCFFDKLSGRGKYCVAVSQGGQKDVEESYGLPCRCIPNGVDVNLFTPRDKQESRRHFQLPLEKSIGIFVGRFDADYKGFDILIEVAKALPEILFFIVTDTQVTGLPENMVVQTHLPHQDLPKVYSAGDFFILPSRFEGCSYTLLEAMACNLPVVVHEQIWPISREPKGIGFFTKSWDPQVFIEAIRRSIASEKKLEPRQMVKEEFSLDLFLSRYRALVEELLKRPFER